MQHGQNVQPGLRKSLAESINQAGGQLSVRNMYESGFNPWHTKKHKGGIGPVKVTRERGMILTSPGHVVKDESKFSLLYTFTKVLNSDYRVVESLSAKSQFALRTKCILHYFKQTTKMQK